MNSVEESEKEKVETVQKENVNPQDKKEKRKRKFTWTPKRRAAFEKCVAARRNKSVDNVSEPEKKKVIITKYESSSSNESESDSDTNSTVSSEKPPVKLKKSKSKSKSKHKKNKEYKNDFYQLAKEMKSIKKSLYKKIPEKLPVYHESPQQSYARPPPRRYFYV